jgi:hypothetical protein
MLRAGLVTGSPDFGSTAAAFPSWVGLPFSNEEARHLGVGQALCVGERVLAHPAAKSRAS